MFAIHTPNFLYLIHNDFKIEEIIRKEKKEFDIWWDKKKEQTSLLNETFITKEEVSSNNKDVNNSFFLILKRMFVRKKIVFQTIDFQSYTYLLVADGITNNNYIIVCNLGALRKAEQKKFLSSYLFINNCHRNDTYSTTLSSEESIEEHFFDLTSFSNPLLKANFITQSWHNKLSLLNKEFPNCNLPLTKTAKVTRDAFETYVSQYFLLNSNSLKCGVISPFSYGKSAFINSLLGFPTLQEDILVKTARVTEIHYHQELRFIADYNTKTSKPILEIFPNHQSLMDRLDLYTSKEDSIAEPINIALPHHSITNDVVYLDTPGLFGKNESHDILTEKTVSDLDVIIYLLNPMQIGFKPYTDKIIDYQKKYKKLFIFVVNKADLISHKEDRERLEAEIRNKVFDKYTTTPIFFVSSLHANHVHNFKRGLLTLNDLKRNPSIQVLKDNEIITGRLFEEEHVDLLLKSSGIEDVSNYLKRMKNLFHLTS